MFKLYKLYCVIKRDYSAIFHKIGMQFENYSHNEMRLLRFYETMLDKCNVDFCGEYFLNVLKK